MWSGFLNDVPDETPEHLPRQARSGQTREMDSKILRSVPHSLPDLPVVIDHCLYLSVKDDAGATNAFSEATS
jgi:hypothetical protein